MTSDRLSNVISFLAVLDPASTWLEEVSLVSAQRLS